MIRKIHAGSMMHHEMPQPVAQPMSSSSVDFRPMQRPYAIATQQPHAQMVKFPAHASAVRSLKSQRLFEGMFPNRKMKRETRAVAKRQSARNMPLMITVRILMLPELLHCLSPVSVELESAELDSVELAGTGSHTVLVLVSFQSAVTQSSTMRALKKICTTWWSRRWYLSSTSMSCGAATERSEWRSRLSTTMLADVSATTCRKPLPVKIEKRFSATASSTASATVSLLFFTLPRRCCCCARSIASAMPACSRLRAMRPRATAWILIMLWICTDVCTKLSAGASADSYDSLTASDFEGRNLRLKLSLFLVTCFLRGFLGLVLSSFSGTTTALR
mmetsp:Transcript_10464/g.22216  ORF Transcript_10464/g.22216 Transcript_10464/m.22216 type:complete len:333 (+) Transcript_10464:544-1542(+)